MSAPTTFKEKLPIQIGWIITTADADSEGTQRLVERSSALLIEHLSEQFAGFRWCSEVVRQHIAGSRLQVDPLELLQLGVEMKIERRWDFAFVITNWKLLARKQASTVALSSSALETAVLSTDTFGSAVGDEDRQNSTIDSIVNTAQLLLGSMLGLEVRSSSESSPERAMNTPEQPLASSGDPPQSEIRRFSDGEIASLTPRLLQVGDERLEERRRRWNRYWFLWKTFIADPRGILTDIVGYRPWLQPFRLATLTAAAFATTLLLFLGAEVWELGVALSPPLLCTGAALSVVGATAFLYHGQNLSELTRRIALSEQLARSRIVLMLCQLVGMTSLWTLLFLAALIISICLPADVIQSWIEPGLDFSLCARFAAFISTLGTLAGALGGNMEDENEFKAEFFFDEEI